MMNFARSLFLCFLFFYLCHIFPFLRYRFLPTKLPFSESFSGGGPLFYETLRCGVRGGLMWRLFSFFCLLWKKLPPRSFFFFFRCGLRVFLCWSVHMAPAGLYFCVYWKVGLWLKNAHERVFKNKTYFIFFLLNKRKWLPLKM